MRNPKSKNHPKKLELQRETVRSLTPIDASRLDEVAGGVRYPSETLRRTNMEYTI